MEEGGVGVPWLNNLFWWCPNHCCNNKACWSCCWGGRLKGGTGNLKWCDWCWDGRPKGALWKLKWWGGDVEDALDDVDDVGDNNGDTGSVFSTSLCRFKGWFWNELFISLILWHWFAIRIFSGLDINRLDCNCLRSWYSCDHSFGMLSSNWTVSRYPCYLPNHWAPTVLWRGPIGSRQKLIGNQ